MWPPAGIALAGCIIWRSKFLPAIILGSMSFNIGIQLLKGADLSLYSIPLAFGIATGSALQAWVNLRLLERFSVDILKEPQFRHVTLFIVLAIASCAISSSIGNLLISLNVHGEFVSDGLWVNTLIWWVGDFFGVIIVSPIVLAIYYTRKATYQSCIRYKSILTPLCLLVVALVVSQQYAEEIIENRNIDKLNIHAELVESNLRQQINSYESRLELLALAVGKKENISKDDFQQLARPFVEEVEGIKAVSWNPVIDQERRSVFEDEVKHQVRGEAIYPDDPLVIVKWIEPLKDNEKAVGFNVFSNESRRSAMINAQNSHSVVATEAIKLVQHNKNEPGFLIFAPVHIMASEFDKKLDSSLQLMGFVVGVFVIDDIVEATLSATSTKFMDVVVYDQSADGAIIYTTGPQHKTINNSDGVKHVVKLNVANRQWLVSLIVSPDAFTSLIVYDSLKILIYQATFGVFVVFLILALFGNTERLKTLVRERTQALESSTEQLKELAFYDHLTKLPNRRMFLQSANHATELAERSGKQVAVLFMDLNRFKQINDSLGHDFGDKLLIEVAGRIDSAIRKSDIVARFGGDEFTILLENLECVEQALHVSDNLIASLREPIVIGNETVTTSTSIGIALYPKDGRNINDLLRAADTAMYKAKELSAGVHCYSESLRENAAEQLLIESEMSNVIKNQQLELFFQPIINLSTMSHAGCECLLRWKHPVHGIISPELFIPIAELSGEIINIGQWVIEQACQKIEKWKQQNLPFKKVTVNVSAKQLTHKTFFQDVRASVMQYSIKPGELEIEITESVLMQDIKNAMKVLTQLKGLGIKIAIDDYGTGYSSLSYLKQMPVDYLKIDRSFIASLNRDDMAIVRSTLYMAKELGIAVIAEGIETSQQLAILTGLECEYGQGYLFSKPVPYKEYYKYVSSLSSYSRNNLLA